jgi:hypothetical protein
MPERTTPTQGMKPATRSAPPVSTVISTRATIHTPKRRSKFRFANPQLRSIARKAKILSMTITGVSSMKVSQRTIPGTISTRKPVMTMIVARIEVPTRGRKIEKEKRRALPKLTVLER